MAIETGLKVRVRIDDFGEQMTGVVDNVIHYQGKTHVSVKPNDGGKNVGLLFCGTTPQEMEVGFDSPCYGTHMARSVRVLMFADN